MPARKNLPTTGCSLVVGRLLWEQEFPGSIPGIPTRAARLLGLLTRSPIRYEEDGNLLARDARETGFNSQVPDYDVAPPRGRLRRMGHHGFLAQFGKSARLKPERSLVRFQEFLLQTCLTSI